MESSETCFVVHVCVFFCIRKYILGYKEKKRFFQSKNHQTTQRVQWKSDWSSPVADDLYGLWDHMVLCPPPPLPPTTLYPFQKLQEKKKIRTTTIEKQS